MWAVYSCAIGALAGAWFEHNHLLGITVALIAAMVMALVLERMSSIGHRALDRRAEQREAEQALVHQQEQAPATEQGAGETAADGQQPGPVDQRPSPAATGGVESQSTPRGEESPA